MNRLAKEKSPYLLQHAHNPVDWHPWGEEAFAKARRENKPVFVSIGYSTCHWCHVMERESFESQEAAARLNRDFVAIKVDREERPDIDQVYMTFVQATTGSGGWPLNVFVTPEGRPFYGGTYFAPDRRYGRPGFGEVLEEIARVFKEQRGEVDQACAGYSKFLESRMQPVGAGSASVPGRQLLAASVWEAARSGFDARWGGWGGAPKFPMPFNLIFLLGHARWAREPEAGRMAIDTLFKMSRGGIRDVVGGGFHRYSVDRRWQVPHFEKMLYDQAGILDALTWAFRFSGEENLLKVAAEIVSYVERDLKAPNGAFYSAEDADSANPDDPAGPKTEGAFYLWREAELRALLSAGEFECVRRVYGIRVDGNIHEDPHGEFGGLNILSRGEGGEGSSAGDEEALRSALAKLSAARAKRPRPSRDTKVLADWNGLWIAALARYGAASGSLSAVHDAEAAAEFFWNQSREMMVASGSGGRTGNGRSTGSSRITRFWAGRSGRLPR